MPDEPTAPAEFPPPLGGRSPDVLVIAGEHSGDEHASLMVADLLEARPDWRVACLGGERLRAAGAQLLYDLTAVSIVGFAEVVRHLNFFRDVFERALRWIERWRPRHVCLVDYPGFNLRLAAKLARRGLSRKGGGAIGVSYYIAPQVWAWKAKRRFRMAEIIDRLGVIFPFELETFADTSLPVEFVGHPFARSDYAPPFAREPGGPLLLLPGSRSGSAGRIFPVLLDALARVRRELPEQRAVVVYPSETLRGELRAMAERKGFRGEALEWAPNSTRARPVGATLTSSGTMSLACALAGVPGAIVYRLNPVSYWMGRLWVRVPYIGIGNLLLGESVHPEFIQGAARAPRLAREALEALRSERRHARARDAAERLRACLRPASGMTPAAWLARGVDVADEPLRGDPGDSSAAASRPRTRASAHSRSGQANRE